MPNPGFVYTSQSGCLLPILIMFNLFFGKLIFSSTRLWLGVEVVLVLLFIIKIHAFTRKISEQLKPGGDDRKNVVDVEGEVVEEKLNLK